MKRPRRILLTATGKDRPGITSLLASILEKRDARILDIGQSVLHGHLSLSILFEAEDAEGAVKDALFEAPNHGLTIEHRAFEEEAGISALDRSRGKDLRRYAVTLFAPSLTARMVRNVAELLARHGLNIDEILRLSELSPVSSSSCIEFQVSSRLVPDEGKLKRELLRLASIEEIDLAIQPEGFVRRSKRLIAFDMDSTLIENEMIDEIAEIAGVGAEVARITTEAMEGKLDYRESLEKRVLCLKGLPASELDRAYSRVRVTAGARELLRILRRLGFRTALLSGGFDFAAEKLARELGIDEFHANRLEIKDGFLTGRVHPPILDAEGKARKLEEIAGIHGIPLDQTVAIGDGANDLLMLERAGLGIAFRAKPMVRERAGCALTGDRSLRPVIFLLGLSEREAREIESE